MKDCNTECDIQLILYRRQSHLSCRWRSKHIVFCYRSKHSDTITTTPVICIIIPHLIDNSSKQSLKLILYCTLIVHVISTTTLESYRLLIYHTSLCICLRYLKEMTNFQLDLYQMIHLYHVACHQHHNVLAH